MTRTVAKISSQTGNEGQYQSTALKDQSSIDRLIEVESKNYHQLSSAEQMSVDMRILKKLK
jgi:hypothetical protein